MAPWVKQIFTKILPKLLFMKRPKYSFETKFLLKNPQQCFYPYHSTTHLNRSPQVSRSGSKDDLSPTSFTETTGPFGGSCQVHGPVTIPHSESEDLSMDTTTAGEIKSPDMKNPGFSHSDCLPQVHKSCFCVRFIAEHTKMLEDSTKVRELKQFF